MLFASDIIFLTITRVETSPGMGNGTITGAARGLLFG